MFWDRESETLSRPELERLQLKRLQETVERVAAKVPHYQRAMADHGARPEQIKTLDDLRRLPFTTGADLRSTYPAGMLAVDAGVPVRLWQSPSNEHSQRVTWALDAARADVERLYARWQELDAVAVGN